MAERRSDIEISARAPTGQRPAQDAVAPASFRVGGVLARERSVSKVRCFEGSASAGWDVICTYFDSTMGERMKLGYRVGPGSAISSSGSVPAGMPLPAA
jgi:hypothetical protein